MVLYTKQAESLIERVFRLESSEFTSLALDIFRFQYEFCNVYRQYVDLLKIEPSSINDLSQIPFLPVSFFRTHKVFVGNDLPEIYFLSSGTTEGNRSRHFVKEPLIYERSIMNNFIDQYGDPSDWVIIALLPSYKENKHASLIYMVDKLIGASKNEHSGYFQTNDYKELAKRVKQLLGSDRRVMLIGVSYALLDFSEAAEGALESLVCVETGGMKGRRKEMVREELHQILKTRLGVKQIHSEYGMTELLSQAYAKRKGEYIAPAWMRVLVRDVEDPFSYLPCGKTGGINIIDLTNIYSCSFIETKDLGKVHDNGYFEVLGRFDNSDLRGCNLIYG